LVYDCLMPIVKGHEFEYDQRRTVRKRDIRVYSCTLCGKVAEVSMRSFTPDKDLEELKVSECPVASGVLTTHEG